MFVLIITFYCFALLVCVCNAIFMRYVSTCLTDTYCEVCSKAVRFCTSLRGVTAHAHRVAFIRCICVCEQWVCCW